MLPINILSVVYAARRDSGYVVSDFKRYRDRCAQRIACYRRLIGVKGMFYKEDTKLSDNVNWENSGESVLLMVLFEAERAFGEAMLATQAMQVDAVYSKMKRRVAQRLRRAVERASVVESLGKRGCGLYLPCLFYKFYLSAILEQEKEDCATAASSLGVCKAILEKLMSLPGQDTVALQFFLDDIDKRYNYCAYVVSAFLDDTAAVDLLNKERDHVVAETVDAAVQFCTIEGGSAALEGATFELPLILESAVLARPQGPVLKRLEELLQAKPLDVAPVTVAHELLEDYKRFYTHSLCYYLDDRLEKDHTTLCGIVSSIKTKGSQMASYRGWIARMHSLCRTYREKSNSFDASRLDTILSVLKQEERSLKILSGLTLIVYRLVYFLGKIANLDNKKASTVSLRPTPLKGKDALKLVVDTVAALEDMSAPTHRAISAINVEGDLLLQFLVAIHTLESGLFLCNKHAEEQSEANSTLKENLLRQAIARLQQFSDSAASANPAHINLKVPNLNTIFPDLISLLADAFRNKELLMKTIQFTTNQLIVSVAASRKQAEPIVFQLYGLLPPPYTEDAIPAMITPDFVTKFVPKTGKTKKAAANVNSTDKDKEVVEKVDAPRKKRFFGLFNL